MSTVIVKLSPLQGGKEFEMANVRGLTWRVNRPANAGGTIARDGFDIGAITVQREKSLENAQGKAEAEDDAILVASKRGERAYIKGEITIAPAGAPDNIVQTLRFDRGFISGIDTQISVDHDGRVAMHETLDIHVTGLKVNDGEFPRVHN